MRNNPDVVDDLYRLAQKFVLFCIVFYDSPTNTSHYMGKRSDLDIILRRNHLYKIWWRSVEWFWCGEGSNFRLSHWLVGAALWCKYGYGVALAIKTLDSRGRESQPFQFHVTTLGKLFTHMCLCHKEQYNFGTGQRAGDAPQLGK